MDVTPPPATSSYNDLVNLQKLLQDAIILVIDFEATSQERIGIIDPVQSVSQMGMAYLDMKELGKPFMQLKPEEVAVRIGVTHDLVDHREWKVRGISKRNRKSRFNSRFCRSCVVRTADQTLERAKHHIQALRTPKLTAPKRNAAGCPSKVTKPKRREPDNSIGNLLNRLATSGEWPPAPPPREVYVLFWDSLLEKKVLDATRHDLFADGGPVQFWDLQQWLPVKRRHSDKAQCPCSEFIAGAGLKEMDHFLHNAANDAWAVLMGFLQVLGMDEEAFRRYVAREGELVELDFSWVDKSIYKDNKDLRSQTVRQH